MKSSTSASNGEGKRSSLVSNCWAALMINFLKTGVKYFLILHYRR